MAPSALLTTALISVLATPPATANPSLTPDQVSVGAPAPGPQSAPLQLRVAASPELVRDQRRARLFIPGVVGASVGGSWLAISAGVGLFRFVTGFPFSVIELGDGQPSAMGVTFRFAAPFALLATGLVFVAVGDNSRRRVKRARAPVLIGPQLSDGGGGLSVRGRF